MRFLIVRTDIRTAADNDIAAAWAGGGRLRDETTAPEPRRQIVHGVVYQEWWEASGT